MIISIMMMMEIMMTMEECGGCSHRADKYPTVIPPPRFVWFVLIRIWSYSFVSNDYLRPALPLACLQIKYISCINADSVDATVKSEVTDMVQFLHFWKCCFLHFCPCFVLSNLSAFVRSLSVTMPNIGGGVERTRTQL